MGFSRLQAPLRATSNTVDGLEPEPILEPGLEIVDAHHHLWARPGDSYLLEQACSDFTIGHRVVQTVHVQCRNGYDHALVEAHPALAADETAWLLATTAACAKSCDVEIAAGVVGYGDLRLGPKINLVVDAHRAAGGTRFVGIRHITAHHGLTGSMATGYPAAPQALISAEALQAGHVLQREGLTLDVMVFHTQLAEVAQYAAALPGLRIVLNHIGVPFRKRLFAAWKSGMAELAEHPNVFVKLGGFALPYCDFGAMAPTAALEPRSLQLARAFTPWVDACIQQFGPSRCMFESNFPVDRGQSTYRDLWNAFKRITSACSAAEKAQLFSGTARRAYGLHAR
jgi:L-fuconolactonase